MFGLRTRALTGFTLMATACGLTATAQAQLFRGLDPCNTCAQPVAIAPPIMQSACACVQPVAMQPVTETVYEDVPHVEMVAVQRSAKMPKVVTVMEERDVVSYQTVNETRTVDVPTYINQNVTECQQVTCNQSYWRTAYQPVSKLSPCAYDARPGLMGELNRMGYSMRNSLTPNYVTRREFVPNVQTVAVPVQRTVQIPTTRQVTYNIPRTVAVNTKQQVAVAKTIMEDTMVTVMEPRSTTRKVAVTRTRMAFIDPGYGAAGTISASNEPTPTAAKPGEKGATRLQSAPSQSIPLQYPSYQQNVQPEPQPAAEPAQPTGPVATVAEPAIELAGWTKTRKSINAEEGPELVARK